MLKSAPCRRLSILMNAAKLVFEWPLSAFELDCHSWFVCSSKSCWWLWRTLKWVSYWLLLLHPSLYRWRSANIEPTAGWRVVCFLLPVHFPSWVLLFLPAALESEIICYAIFFFLFQIWTSFIAAEMLRGWMDPEFPNALPSPSSPQC